ncbi:sigma-70 family RNA polymerase sigma factor [Chromobacterium sp. IRSSSOUMB001]|uniref:sigma-70 family RNA polymerase sigma factor n=1 Tax=Chromobacterium sp. IRSSSOUMB001 TaxID=2927123 RepID=UPI0020BD9C01|nr:sigma-70 family RNA polymerase sigma factor [Chromobacterium sp. IRSSSOUMB001]
MSALSSPLDGDARDLSQAADTASSEARAALVEAHQPLVRILAARIYARRVGDSFEFHDVFHWGMIGLLEAIDHYRSECGVAFKTYAEYRIRGAILDQLARTSEVASQASARRKALQERVEAIEPDTAEPFNILRELSVGLAIGFMLEDSGMYLAEPEPLSEDTAYRSLELKETRRDLLDSLAGVPDKAQKVLRLHYLNGVPFSEIAQLLGLSKGRISQLHKEGLALLRAGLTSKKEGVG